MANRDVGANFDKENSSRRGILSGWPPSSWADLTSLRPGASGTARAAATAGMATRSLPEIYSRYSTTKLLHDDQPLYCPDPDSTHPSHYQKTGVRIGDVGLITQDGAFVPLFNVCDEYKHTNPSTLPNNFETINDIEIAKIEGFSPETHLLSLGVHRKKLSDALFSYHCFEEAGAILELPEGATLFEAKNVRAFKDLAKRHAKSWKKYVRTNRPKSASNETLYLVTGCIKTEVWGIAVFNKPSTSGDYLQFTVDETIADRASPSRYGWKCSGSVTCKVRASELNSGNKENQCIFLRGLELR